MEDAIKKEILVPYDYAFAMSYLNDVEQEDYDKLSLQISQLIARINSGDTDDALEFFLMDLNVPKIASNRQDIM